MAEIKPLAGMERKKLKEAIPLRTPYAVYFFPTNLCNFMCRYCAHSGGLKNFEAEYGLKPETMSFETFARAIDQIKDFKDRLKVINLSGQGEPLLNPAIADMVRYAREADVVERIEIITNASLLTNELSDRLIDAGLDCIRISLQGMSDETYFNVCGKKVKVDSLFSNIEYFYRHKKQCQVYVKVMDVALREGEEDLFYRTFDRISDRMYIEQCKPVYDSVEMTQDMRTDTDRYGRAHEPRQVCPLPFYMLGILPDGTISPCETIYVPEILGNVWKDELPQVWNGDKMKLFQQMQLKKMRKDNPKCARCCAPDDVAHPDDDLDDVQDGIIV
ncbi:MAG: radical SAM protein [Lachnospiraceae bacterium]|nr:radical SAM protein [Butyrivibrio sp.]MCM1342417.1 radical SAM protein [Muribaculaceae bacterium]MCM1410276.1 radical SAM protein [Lachnospiraceae bacterium]